MSIELLERGVAALSDLVDEVVFVGGATTAGGSFARRCLFALNRQGD